MEVNDRFQFCHDGYRDITLLFDMSGVICEVQMQIKGIQEVKKSGGHKAYRVQREVNELIFEAAVQNSEEAESATPKLRRQGPSPSQPQSRALFRTVHAGEEMDLASLVKAYNVTGQGTKDKNGRSALHYTCQHGALKATRVLLAAGSSIWLEDDNGVLPFELALKQKRFETLFLCLTVMMRKAPNRRACRWETLTSYDGGKQDGDGQVQRQVANMGEEEGHHGPPDDEAFFQDAWEDDSWLSMPADESDQDVLVVQQFEESLIDVLQGDPETGKTATTAFTGNVLTKDGFDDMILIDDPGASPNQDAATRQQAETQEEEEYRHLSLTELHNHKISFGTQKKGMTFKEVCDSDHRYVAWFANTYGDSTKHSHKKFLHYVNLYTEHLETQNEGKPKSSAYPGTMPKSRAQPKSVVKGKITSPRGEQTPPTPPSSQISPRSPRSHNETWELVGEETEHQNQRISQIEMAMGQVVQQLQILTTQLFEGGLNTIFTLNNPKGKNRRLPGSVTDDSEVGSNITASETESGHFQEQLAIREAAPISPITWFSKKINRVVGSTLASETFALSGQALEVAWLWTAFVELRRLLIEVLKCYEALPFLEPFLTKVAQQSTATAAAAVRALLTAGADQVRGFAVLSAGSESLPLGGSGESVAFGLPPMCKYEAWMKNLRLDSALQKGHSEMVNMPGVLVGRMQPSWLVCMQRGDGTPYCAHCFKETLPGHLKAAAKLADSGYARAALLANADPRAQQAFAVGKRTALMAFAAAGDLELCRQLVAARSEVQWIDGSCCSAVHYALALKRHEVADFLRQQRAITEVPLKHNNVKDVAQYLLKAVQDLAPGMAQLVTAC
ncbi:Hypothetical protein (Fragment) [Durusdinium trenchii]|uniref:Uncharacterized protein n=1 Tax=Durusdinium trenchii TaxID=1381693 RepID=A0ABP0H500_9DINO